MLREIGFAGYSDTAHGIAREVYGTPLGVVRDAMRVFGGVDIRHLESMKLSGKDNRGPSRNTVYDDPVKNLGLYHPHNPISLTELIFNDYKLEHLPTSINVTIALSTLCTLRLHQCDNTDDIFPNLTPYIHLHTLEIENFTSKHPLSLTNLLPFLSSFTLRSLIYSLPDPTSTWTAKPIIDALKSHEELQTCILSIGTHAATLPDLRALRSNDPHLRTLGFRINPANKTPRNKHLTHNLAVEVVQFRELKKWQIVGSMPRGVGGMDSCKARYLADSMRRT